MKVEDVYIMNWQPTGQPPGSDWWSEVESKPDEPLIKARIVLTLTWNEYHRLCLVPEGSV